MKECTKCKEVKPLTDFYKNKANKDGRGSYCKPCSNRNSLDWAKNNPEAQKKHKRNSLYKLDKDWYELTLVKQHFRCAGCLTHQKDLEYSLCVDHCHTTDKPRGLLCKPCNFALGHCDDDPDTLRRLAKYAEETRQTTESEDRGPEEG
jgi:hypothetical protein